MTLPGMQKLRTLKKAKSLAQLPSVKRQRKAEKLKGGNMKISQPRHAPVIEHAGPYPARQETPPSADDDASVVALAPVSRSRVALEHSTYSISREVVSNVHPLRSHPSREFVESPRHVSLQRNFVQIQPAENARRDTVTDPVRTTKIPYKQSLQDALLSVNPLTDEDAPLSGGPRVYGDGSRYHAYSRPETFVIPPNVHRHNVEPVLASRLCSKSRSTPNLLASGQLRPVAEDEPSWPLPVRPLNDDRAKRQGRVFSVSELPSPLRPGYQSPNAPVTPLSPRDEENLHIKGAFHMPPAPQPLEKVINASINRRRARQAKKEFDEPQPSSSPVRARRPSNASTSDTDDSSSTFSHFHGRQDEDIRIKRNSSAELLTLPDHYGGGHLPFSPAASTLNSSAPSSLFISRQYDERIAQYNQNRGAELLGLPGHYGPLPTPSLTRESRDRISMLTATTDSLGDRSLRSKLARVLQDHERRHLRHSIGIRDSISTDNSSTKSVLDKITEALASPHRHSRPSNGRIVSPLARSVRATISRDKLRRKPSLEDLRDENYRSEITRKRSADKLSRPSSISTIDMLNGVGRKVKKTAKVAKQGWRSVFYKGQVDVKLIKTVLSNAIEPALGGLDCDFTEWGR